MLVGASMNFGNEGSTARSDRSAKVLLWFAAIGFGVAALVLVGLAITKAIQHSMVGAGLSLLGAIACAGTAFRAVSGLRRVKTH